MNILHMTKHTKTVNYFGWYLDVPFEVNYITTSKQGNIWGHTAKPDIVKAVGIWSTGFRGVDYRLGIAEKGTFSWKESLMELED